jgi:predicted outer membrane repeat protein
MALLSPTVIPIGVAEGYISQAVRPTVTNCTFLNNSAGQNGGGAIHSWNSSPLITNCIFAHNDGGSNGGGAIFNWDCPDVTILHCTFSENNGGISGGGAIYNYNSSTTVTSCILWDDVATTGSEVYNQGGTLTIKSCDLAGNVAGIANVDGGTINTRSLRLQL